MRYQYAHAKISLKLLAIPRCGTLICCWECKLVWQLWKTVGRFSKMLNIYLPYDPEIVLLTIYPEKMKRCCSHKNLDMNFFNGFTHYSPELKTTQMSFKCWMGEYCMEHTCNGILFSNRKE